MRLARALLGLALVAGGARAADFTLDDVSVTAGATTFRAARVEVSGSPLDRAAAQALLSSADARSIGERLAAIKARRIVIPELAARSEVAGVTQTVVYRDLALGEVDAGRAASMTAAGARFDSRRRGRDVNGACGAMDATGVDFVAIARLMGEGRGEGEAAPQTKARTFSIADCAFTSADGVRISIGRSRGRDIGGRPLVAPVASLIQSGPDGASQPDSPATQRAVALLAADLIDSMAFGAIEVDDVRAAGGEAGKGVDLKIRRVAFTGARDSRIADITIEGLSADTPDGPASFDRATLAGLDVKPVFAAALAQSARQATPRFDAFEITDLAVRGLGIGRLRVDAGQWYDLAPSLLAATAERAKIDVAAFGMTALAALGYASIEARGAFRMRYDVERRTLAFAEISSEAPGLGRTNFSAEFSKVQPEVFSGDAQALKSALPAIFFSQAALRLEDLGVFARMAARPDGPSRAQLGQTARLVARGLLGEGPAGAPAVDAIGRFFESGRSLAMKIEAPQPIGMIDLMMAGRLSGLADRLKIETKTE